MVLAVKPRVFLVAKTQIDIEAMQDYFRYIGAPLYPDNPVLTNWSEQDDLEDGIETGNGTILVEFMGRLCYKSWDTEMNPNITRIRTDQKEYIENVLRSGHGSVIEHPSYSFAIAYLSRVATHELVRHRAGTAISQESGRFVRLDDIPFEHPIDFQNNPGLCAEADELLLQMETFQKHCVEFFGLDNEGTPFDYKKRITSSMRRYGPTGVATQIGWTCNARELRHAITMRTAVAAELEIREIFNQIADIMVEQEPLLFQDFEQTNPDKGPLSVWVPKYVKV